MHNDELVRRGQGGGQQIDDVDFVVLAVDVAPIAVAGGIGLLFIFFTAIGQIAMAVSAG